MEMKIMEEELNYVTMTFKNPIITPEKRNEQETIYDEVKTEERTWDTNPVTPEQSEELEIIYDDEMKTEARAWDTNPVTPAGNKKKASLSLLAAALGAILIILVSVIVVLCIRSNTVTSEYTSVSAQNLQLRTEKTALETQMEELTRDRNRLSWTMGVILQHRSFPVATRCPKKVCKPCLDGWLLFQSSCYLFLESDLFSGWKSWGESSDSCINMNAHLAVIDSRTEQEFIKNHTKYYQDDRHGYWIGLSKNTTDKWTWVDGSNFTETDWTALTGSKGRCVLTQSSKWKKAGCDMKNRWICETKSLIKLD